MIAEALKYLSGLSAAKGEVVKDEAGRYLHVITHKDTELKSLEHLNEKPARINQSVNFADVRAFIDYVKDFILPNTRLFSDLDKLNVTAFINHHNGALDPTWNTHNAQLALRKDKDFKSWEALDGSAMSHGEFINFLLDYKDSFIVPDKAQILELVAGIKATGNSTLDSDVERYGAGEVLAKTFKVTAKNGVLPDIFTVRLPVIEGFDAYDLQFRLVFVPEGNRLLFKIQLIRPHLVLAQVFNDILGDIAEETKATIYGHRKLNSEAEK